MLPSDLLNLWRVRADGLAPYAPPAAAAFRAAAQELEEALRLESDEALTLAQAAMESGYSERRIRELIADGKVPQAGKRGAPRVRRRDLPSRPGNRHGTYDPAAAAARIHARRSA